MSKEITKCKTHLQNLKERIEAIEGEFENLIQLKSESKGKPQQERIDLIKTSLLQLTKSSVEAKKKSMVYFSNVQDYAARKLAGFNKKEFKEIFNDKKGKHEARQAVLDLYKDTLEGL